MASQELLRLFNHKDNDVRINAIYTYGYIRRSPADEEITQLINLLKDENASIRVKTAETLGRLEAKAAINALKQMVVYEKYVYPWASAIWAILQIEPSFSEVIKENGWESPYIIQLHDEDIDKRKLAADVLERIGTEIALPYLKEMYEDDKNKIGISGELFNAIKDIEGRINC